jgi:tRNA(His) 5'-end guanylyltransferase
MNKNDSLGDRIKNNYESRSQTHLPRRTYTIVRLDGKSFSRYTKNLQRPYDLGLMEDMDETAKFLCENIQGCKLAYVQSDEISLVLTDFDNMLTDAWFDGNVQKITSVSASLATAKFNHLRMNQLIANRITNSNGQAFTINVQDYQNFPLANFDSRAFSIPDPTEVHNYFVFRQKDAIRNSIQMTGQAYFSPKMLHGKSCEDIVRELANGDSGHEVVWSDLPKGFQQGRCVVKVKETATYDGKPIERSVWKITTPPVFTNAPDFIWCYVPKIVYPNC